jgi:hypothetical protein
MNNFLIFDYRYALEPAFPEVFSPVSTVQLPDSSSWVIIRSIMLSFVSLAVAVVSTFYDFEEDEASRRLTKYLSVTTANLETMLRSPSLTRLPLLLVRPPVPRSSLHLQFSASSRPMLVLCYPANRTAKNRCRQLPSRRLRRLYFRNSRFKSLPNPRP